MRLNLKISQNLMFNCQEDAEKIKMGFGKENGTH